MGNQTAVAETTTNTISSGFDRVIALTIDAPPCVGLFVVSV